MEKKVRLSFCFNDCLVFKPTTKIIGLGFDRARTKRNSANEIVYSETNKRIALGDPVYPTQRLTQQEVLIPGFINYIFDYLYGSIYNYNTRLQR